MGGGVVRVSACGVGVRARLRLGLVGGDVVVLISQHPCSNGVSVRVRKSNASQGQARQTKSNREN